VCARCPGTQDATADQYGRARQTVVFLLILYHWRHHAARLATGSTPARYVYHRRQVAVLQDVCLSVCLSVRGQHVIKLLGWLQG